MSVERACSLLVVDSKPQELLKVDDLRKQLEKGNAETKIEAMRRIVIATANGEKFPQLLMTTIRFVMPEQSHQLKKLLLLFWESVDKIDPQTGKLRPEFILVCNSLLHDLQHPNEYICGSTLRLLCRIKDPEIVEPLVAAVRQTLENRHAYVRRNAVWAIYTIFRSFPHLIPNAPDLVTACLEAEGDASCKRNALLMLYHCAQEKAVAYINSVLEQVPNFGEILQLAVVEILFKICRAGCPQNDRSKYIACVAALLGASSPSVRLEAAGTLLALSIAPSSVKNAALAYIDLLVGESDNNVKLVVLARLDEVAKRCPNIMQDVVMDILRGLNCPTLDIKKKTLSIALDLVTQRNVLDVVSCLKRELIKASSEIALNSSSSSSSNSASDYRQILVQSVHLCAVRFPSVAADVVRVLMDYIYEPINPSAISSVQNQQQTAASNSAFDVIAFIREAVERYPELRQLIIIKLSESLKHMRSSKVFRATLWVLGEYAELPEDIIVVINALKESLKDISKVIIDKEEQEQQAAAATSAATFQQQQQEKEKEKELKGSSPSTTTTTTTKESKESAPKQTNVRVLADGTYASQSVPGTQTSTSASAATTSSTNTSGGGINTPTLEARKRSPLLALLLDGDHFLSSVVAYTLTKLAIRGSDKITDLNSKNKLIAEVLLNLAQLIRLGTSHAVARLMDSDSKSRVILCVNSLANENHPSRESFKSTNARKSFSHLLEEQVRSQQRAIESGGISNANSLSISGVNANDSKVKKENENQADDLIRIRQLTAKTRGTSAPEEDIDAPVDDDVSALERLDRSGGDSGLVGEMSSASSRLSRVVQLTGFSDPLYAEAFVYVHQYDVVLDVLITNQTNQTLQNVTLELATLGDLKLFEHPQAATIAPNAVARVKANLKVSSTETGVIFGNIVYEQSGQTVTQTTADRNCVPLNEMHIDILDYVRPATCTDVKFRQMWAEFEWENKIAVVTNLKSVTDYLQHVVKATNMNCLTPPSALGGDCSFLVANLYARSVFGEDALANVSVEMDVNSGKVSGFVRIRSKTQGIALSLGEKIIQKQQLQQTTAVDRQEHPSAQQKKQVEAEKQQQVEVSENNPASTSTSEKQPETQEQEEQQASSKV